MPELPEVETTMRGLAPVLTGRVITGVTVRAKRLRRDIPTTLTARLVGKRVIALARRAKYILWHLEGGTTVIIHLGMSGGFRVANNGEAPGPHDHVIFDIARDRLIYHDPRRFGVMAVADTKDLDLHPLLKDLGPEPLTPDFTGRVLRARLGNRRGPLKTSLLDQHVVAGVGNIYASEALFYARLSPDLPAGSLTLAMANRLASSLQNVLSAAIAAGGSSLRDYRQVDGNVGFFQNAFAVYNQGGKPCPGCRCGGKSAIQKIVQAGRSTYFCPVRQTT